MTCYEELGKIPAKNIIPDYCLTFSEGALYVAEAASEGYNQLFESIGLEELAVYESTGSVIIYEGEKLDAIKAKIEKALNDFWASIKAAFEKFIKWLKETCDKFGEKVTKWIDSMGAKLLKYNDLKASDLDDVDADKFKSKVPTFKIKETKAKITAFGKKVASIEKDASNKLSTADVNEAKQLTADTLEKMYKEFNGASKISDIGSKIKELAIGDDVAATKDWCKKNFNAVKDVVSGGLTVVRESYKEEKNMFAVAKTNVRAHLNKDLNNYNYKFKITMASISAVHAANMAICDVERIQLHKYFTLMFQMVGLIANAKKAKAKEEKKAEKEVKNESAGLNSIIDSVFEW